MKAVIIILILLLVVAVAGVRARSSQPASQPIPEGMVAFFSYAGGQGCPAGWKEAQYASGRLILGTTNGQKIQIISGTPLADQQVPTHTHAYSGTASVGDTSTATVGGSDKGVGQSGSYSTSGTSESADTSFPFVQYLACEYFGTSSGDALPFSSVAFFNLANCPPDWAAMNSADGRFILATPAQGKSGFTTTLAWTLYADPGHTHSFSGSVSIGSKGFVWGGGANDNTASPGDQPVSGNLSANTEPVIPFVTLLTCQKQEMGRGQGLPLGITLFLSAANCPNQWGSTPAAPGRFFVGISATGTQGAAFGGSPMGPNETARSHQHWINGSVNISNYNTDLTTTWQNLHLGQKGTSNFTVQSGPTSIELPYVMLEACTYTGVSASSLPVRSRGLS